ncbi:6-methylpretetramide 4-monooxygenase [Usitatibacter rugosus]|uniref:6-methylpretetramide 4-monooxygenase n=1 Tax=Usitatibacter rugosus TaxID=2732067 RepID=A0A6M4GSG4_9PROT|nr:FAD-dependent monooxygenase [Usitatibacter rugosus]QJR09768.1 6-methylpretetramide 4-monooxygenase [Usitatibacter rugosus]
MDTDVLIVGAGPTGLMLANQLARRGVRARIIDRHAGPSRETRALGVHARTLEIYSHLGVIDRALQLGKKGTGGDIWANGKHTGRIPLGDAGSGITPYPYILVLGQDDNERILGDRLRDWNVAVEWNTELTALEQHTDHASATLKMPDGTSRTLDAAWIAGCDGAHSAVRELNGIAFPGAPYEHVFYVADVEMTGTMVPDEVNVYLWRAGFHLFFPMRGKDHWRIVGIVPEGMRERKDLGFDDVVPSIQGESESALSFRTCSWFSTYRIHHRSAERFRDRRCFVLGDAAHIHSPVGAQGMNTGLQDAYNLAWKLALVVQGRAPESMIDTYAEERMPVAKRLLDTTDRAFRVVVSDSWLAGLLRTHVLARVAAMAMSNRRIQRAAFLTVSQTGIHYRGRSLSTDLAGLPHGAPHAGDRFPWLRLKLRAGGAVEDVFALDDTRCHLLVFGQPLPKDLPSYAGLLEAHEIPDDPANDAVLAESGIAKPSFYLVRPDGHIGLCGTRLETAELQRYYGTRVLVAGPMP